MKFFPSKPLRLPRFRTYVPRPDDPKIFWFNSERDDIVQQVVSRIMERYADEEAAELILNDCAYHEVRRLENRTDDSAKRELDQWRGIIRRVSRMSMEGKHETLRAIALDMAKDVAGNFDPRVYGFASKAVPGLLTAAMNPSKLLRNVLDSGSRMDELVSVEGPIDKIRHLSKRGTIVLVPTHSSNLDSLAIAWALYREGISPVVYGAGKNLFSNPIISFFMHNLGAYRVDRRVRAGLYKEVLKTYSCVTIERGYHSLFFPGGTRSRSGAIERRLKLGLAGTGVEAFSRNQVRGVDRPVYFVPATINYALVLEAETLIDDHLKEQGRARYIIEDDEFSRIERWVSFFDKFFGLDSACVVRFAEPVDPFGNPVDEQGRSIAPDGRTIDASDYVKRRGTPVVDHARDAAYTRELGKTIARAYETETVIMPTQLVAHVIFRRLVRATPGLDLFSRLRHRGDVAIPCDELAVEIGETRDRLLGLADAGKVHAAGVLRRESPDRLLDRALGAWGGYHSKSIAKVVNGSVIADDPNLLLFYQNRVRNFACDLVGDGAPDRAAARDIAALETTPT
ncbi:MAG: 1-acyl-sn-glycerol-3-phosphate acyltransferase [Nannocystaceae bacterium]|nr:1-acyl-sn-glycerol-3-phosphate acyltransferase [Nannocystaceae bacterium]